MRTDIVDPWCGTGVSVVIDGNEEESRFEDSFVGNGTDHRVLSDSDEYLQKLYSKLRSLKKSTSKKELVTSLSAAKEDSIARFITSERNFQVEEDVELSANPLIRHIAPHLQALTASELVHLLKADTLQANSRTEQQVAEEDSTANQDSVEGTENKN